uniref:Uncharacterized protein n=1 Tax=uncultured bacterium contig00077 TaxID=1181555 RepID=A0A806KCR2_9BACT|nr:hypothetical protein [uncultured bacterium contig00077]
MEFKRVQYDAWSEEYVIDKNFTTQYQKNIIYVLNVFDEEYYIKNDKLYISKKLWNDKETLWNYCNKATDSWIQRYEGKGD